MQVIIFIKKIINVYFFHAEIANGKDLVTKPPVKKNFKQ